MKLIATALSVLFLSACGGGSTPAVSGTTTVPIAPIAPITTDYLVELKVSSTPDYTYGAIAASTMVQGMQSQPAGSFVYAGLDGKAHHFIFPTLFYADPQLPGLEFVEKTDGTFGFLRFIDDVKMGSARDWAPLNVGSKAEKRFVVVDHGSEYSAGQSTWPFGDVWVASDKGAGFDFTKISTVRAFNHSVAVGDISGSGRDDIVVVNMGVKTGGVNSSLHHYVQNADGSFTQDRDFLQNTNPAQSGAVAIADLDNDGVPEMVQGNYVLYDAATDWGGVRVWSRKNSSSYQVASTIPRSGNLTEKMGVTQIVAFDYDKDGLLDLLVSLEGATPDASVRYNANGVELYRNVGGLRFQRVTDAMFKQSVWLFSRNQYRELSVVDFDLDGYVDIVLRGWNGSEFKPQPNGTLNIGSLLLKNNVGTGFLTQSDKTGLSEFFGASNLPKYLRISGMENGALKLFGVNQSGAPVQFTVKKNR